MTAKPKKKVAVEKPSLEERIKEIHAEIEKLIDQYLELKRLSCPGIPVGVLRNSNFARAGGCRCEEFKLLQAK